MFQYGVPARKVQDVQSPGVSSPSADTTNLTSSQTKNIVISSDSCLPNLAIVCHARGLLHSSSSAADAGKYNLHISRILVTLLAHPLYVPANKKLFGFSEDR